MFTLILLFLLLNIPHLVCTFIHPRCFWKAKQNKSRDGDLLTSCIFSLGSVKWPVKKEYFNRILNVQTPTSSYKFVLALAFSIDEVNRNSDLLPNMSLIFGLPAGGCQPMSQLHSLIHESEKKRNVPPNYACNDDIGCAVMLTGPYWATSAIMRKVLDFYQSQQVLQLTYGPFHPILSDHEQFPYLYQMALKDTSLAQAMISLMLHFSWNWIGLAISDNDQGIEFLSNLRTEMEKSIVCFAFVNMIPVNMHLYMSRAKVYYNQIMTSSTNVVIIYGDTDSTLAVSFRMWESLGIQKIWVTTSQWDDSTSNKDFTLDSSFGTIAFAHHHAEISGFKNFVQTLTHFRYSDEYLARLEWMKFNCEVTESKWKTLKNCSSNTLLDWLMVQTFDMAFNDGSYDLYNAVYALAHALHEILLQQVNQPMDNGNGHNFNCLKVHSFLRKTQFTNPFGETVNMNQKKNLQPDYDIFQTWNFLQGLGIKMLPSVCSADCGPGFRKYGQEGMAACCFDCIPCPQNEVSNETNVLQCVKCLEDQYANTGKTLCISKAVIFMTYEDPLGMALALMALCFSAFTVLVLGVFVKHHDTPIVKANNRNLSYILLISLIFCFLCSLLFIGQPNSATCILQQITFGVAFTVAVSTVLAKTVTVLLAFTVTVPGRRMKYFLVSRAPNYIIAICTLIQITLCAIWLGASPPSIDIDAHSEHGHIIIVCNKGSVTAFYCVLGYHGSLALGSFIVAFLARNLPDTFNEAKLLTFSMLVFCSVWVTFLPVYHSTKGKVMVAVEIFSILASSVGLLGCIFFPKCYVILLRPERNSLQTLKERAFS